MTIKLNRRVDKMTIYKSRYQARKAAIAMGILSEVCIVKVDAGRGQRGYVLMDWADYHIWGRQK